MGLHAAIDPHSTHRGAMPAITDHRTPIPRYAGHSHCVFAHCEEGTDETSGNRCTEVSHAKSESAAANENGPLERSELRLNIQ